jgi:hypothetical protein
VRAIRFAQRRLTEAPANLRARLILAEGLLCQGLADDTWALDEAIERLRTIVADQPSNIFARAELADGLWKRFPLSEDAAAAGNHVRTLVRTEPPGTARAALASHARENALAASLQWSHIDAILRSRQTAATASQLSGAELYEYATLLALTGAAGVEKAEQLLNADVDLHGETGLSHLARAELALGRASRQRVRDEYEKAEHRLCTREATPFDREQCEFARFRLNQLTMQLTQGGGE